ncbi:hypothetical protein BH11GEM2_BH11GEM2_40830 [soil metagenome]
MTSPLLSFSRTTGDVLPVSLDRLIESRLLIQANSGGGGWTQTRIAVRFGVTQANISEILRRKTWRGA